MFSEEVKVIVHYVLREFISTETGCNKLHVWLGELISVQLYKELFK